MFLSSTELEDSGFTILEESGSTLEDPNGFEGEENDQSLVAEDLALPDTETVLAIREAEERLEELRYENLELHRRVLFTHGRRRSIVDADMLEGQDFFYQIWQSGCC